MTVPNKRPFGMKQHQSALYSSEETYEDPFSSIYLHLIIVFSISHLCLVPRKKKCHASPDFSLTIIVPQLVCLCVCICKGMQQSISIYLSIRVWIFFFNYFRPILAYLFTYQSINVSINTYKNLSINIFWFVLIRVIEHKCLRWHLIADGGCPRGVMVKAMDCGIVVREFVLQSRYYVPFQANTLGKVMNPLILPAMG